MTRRAKSGLGAAAASVFVGAVLVVTEQPVTGPGLTIAWDRAEALTNGERFEVHSSTNLRNWRLYAFTTNYSLRCPMTNSAEFFRVRVTNNLWPDCYSEWSRKTN